MTNKESKILHTLKMCMRDFRPGKDELKGHTDVYSLKSLPLKGPDTPLPYMVFLTLTGILGFGYYGRGEKIAWSIPLVYKETPFMISHQKFGLEIATTGDNCSGRKVKEMIGQLKSGIKIADQLLSPIVAKQVKLGEISIVSKHHMMYDAYSYFRGLAYQAFKKTEAKPPPIKEFKDVTRHSNQMVKWERKGFYYTRAMLDCFYSWLEHVLILLIPFNSYDKKVDNIEKLIFSTWTTKFNRVLKPETDKEAKQVFNELQEIKKKYRNTLAHGHFDKSGASILAHMPIVGAIPISLSSFRNSIHYSGFFPITKDVFPQICSVFDRAESLLRNKRFERPFRIIESGLDICFDDASITEYKEVLKSAKSTEIFIEGMTRMADDAINMDC